MQFHGAIREITKWTQKITRISEWTQKITRITDLSRRITRITEKSPEITEITDLTPREIEAVCKSRGSKAGVRAKAAAPCVDSEISLIDGVESVIWVI